MEPNGQNGFFKKVTKCQKGHRWLAGLGDAPQGPVGLGYGPQPVRLSQVRLAIARYSVFSEKNC